METFKVEGIDDVMVQKLKVLMTNPLLHIALVTFRGRRDGWVRKKE